jgi:hypothetical protein
MAMRTVLARLTDEELKQARHIQARSLVAQSGHPGMTVDDAVEAIEEDIEFMETIRRRYGIPEDETFDLSLTDGVLSEGADA